MNFQKIATFLRSAAYTRDEMEEFQDEIEKRLNVLKADSNIKRAEVADRWNDGYFKILVELKPEDKKSVMFRKNAPYETGYVLPNMTKIKSSINKFFKKERPKFLLPSKKKEYVDKWDDRTPKSYYTSNEIMFEIYMYK